MGAQTCHGTIPPNETHSSLARGGAAKNAAAQTAAMSLIMTATPVVPRGPLNRPVRSLVAPDGSEVQVSGEFFCGTLNEGRRGLGSGLGLAITKRLIEELKGTIEVFSEVSHGSRFVVTIPKTR